MPTPLYDALRDTLQKPSASICPATSGEPFFLPRSCLWRGWM